MQHRLFESNFNDGYARHMSDALPHASFIGFNGMPIKLTDANMHTVLGDYISVYDIQRAVQDGALETNDSAVKVLGDETLRRIARELVQTVRNNVTILRKHGYLSTPIEF